jgi:hypothetical protein
MAAPKRITVPETEPKAALSIPLSQLAFLIVKAREFDAEVPPSGTEDGSDMADDRAVAILEDTPDNPTHEELTAAVRDLNADQLNEVLALVWLGRGDFTGDEWVQAIAQARDLGESRAVRALMDTPLLADLIEDGLGELGYNITDEEMNRS